MSGTEKDNLSDTFDGKRLEDLNKYDDEDLDRVEESLAEEFRALSREFIDARISRIDSIISDLDRCIKVYTENERSWSEIGKEQIERISRIRTATEDYVLSHNNNPNLRKRRDLAGHNEAFIHELSDILQDTKTPTDYAGDVALPFTSKFVKLLHPFNQDLKAIEKECLYQHDLIEADAKRNALLIWNEYFKNIDHARMELYENYLSELTEIQLNSDNCRANLQAIEEWKKYYRSVISITDLKKLQESDLIDETSHDNQFWVDNIYLPKNKIELTDAKYRYLDQIKRNRFTNIDSNNLSTRGTVQLITCQGLNDREIEEDLNSMRKDLTVRSFEEQSENLVESEFSDKEEIIVAEAREELHKAYRELLGLDQKEKSQQFASFVMPNLPPLHQFPKVEETSQY